MYVRIARRRLLALLVILGALAAGLPAARPTRALSDGQAADLVLGHTTFTQGSNTPKALYTPQDVAVDPTTGAVFVADTENHRVLRFDSPASLTNGAPPDGVLGQPDLLSKKPMTTDEGMSRPFGVAVDSAGRLWVADTDNGRVLRFEAAASKPNGAAADGVLGQKDFFSRIKQAGADGMSWPSGLAVDERGLLWVADSSNNRVLRFEAAASKPNGAAADGVLGQPGVASSASATSAQGMWGPSGVAVDGGGRLWVADAGNSRVLRFEAAASKPNGAAADGVLGQPGFTSKDAVTTAAGMWLPSKVAADASGRLWVSDSSRVLRFEAAAGKPNGAAADGVLGQPDFTSRTIDTTAQNMSYPEGLVAETNGRLWVADSWNNRVLRFDAAAGKPNGAAADGVLGQKNFTLTQAISAELLESPGGVAVDPTTGKVFVADSFNNRVLRFATRADLSNGAAAEAVFGQPDALSSAAAAGAQGMNMPIGVAVDGSGRLWVADTSNSRVLRFDAAAGKPSGTAADGVLGQFDFTGNKPATTARLMGAPYSVAVDGDGRLWVADLSNSRVLRFDAAASKPNGAAADGLLGQQNFIAKFRNTGAQGLLDPSGVAVDGSGRLWVADSGNSRVLRFDAAAEKPIGAAADGVLGQPDFTSWASASSAQGMDSPFGVALDARGRLWVTDGDNNRVLWFDAAAGLRNGAPASGVLGQADLTGNAKATTAQGLSSPRGVTVDGAGRLWVADYGNNRALLFETAEPVLRPQVYLPLVRR